MKAMRHAMILEIIDTMKIETQEELAAELPAARRERYAGDGKPRH